MSAEPFDKTLQRLCDGAESVGTDQAEVLQALRARVDVYEARMDEVQVGTTFWIGDLPEGAFEDEETASDWLALNRNHIVEAMTAAGFDAIETCLSQDGIQHD